MFRPSYSPDLNPIKEAFSKIKNTVRKVGARSREALDEAIGKALWAVTLEDVAGVVLALRLRATGSLLMNTTVVDKGSESRQDLGLACAWAHKRG